MKMPRTHALDGRRKILCGTKGFIMTTKDGLITCVRCRREARKGVQLDLGLKT